MASPTPQYESVRIEEVKDKSELLELVHLSVLGLKDDGFTYWIEKYGNTSMFEDTMSKMTTAVDDPNSYIFKAILSTEDESGKRSERLVGLSQWYLGYAEVPKVDPFAGKTVSDESTVPEIVTEIVSSDVKIEGDGKIQAKEDKTQSKSDVLEDMMRRKGNAYIGTIRGKKHVCKYLSSSLIDYLTPEYRSSSSRCPSQLSKKGDW